MTLFCARFAPTRDLRHCRQDLRALHSGECGAALLSGRDPAGRISTLDPFDLESVLRQIAFLFAGQATTAAGVRMRLSEPPITPRVTPMRRSP
jgi:hypothetical protein